MKNILITGANGFIAQSLYSHLLQSGYNVYGIGRSVYCDFIGDIRDMDLMKRIINDNDIDTVFHLAAQAIVKHADKNPAECIEANVMGTVSVLEAVRQINPDIRVVVASSDKAYGNHSELPYRETFDLRASDLYSTSKACTDLIAQSYESNYQMNIAITRCANVYGPGDYNLTRLIPGTIDRIQRGIKPMIYTGVKHYKREFIYIDDVVRAYEILGGDNRSGPYNIGTGETLEVWQVAESIIALMRWDGGIDYVKKSFGEIHEQRLETERILKLGWSPKVNFLEGIEKTIDQANADRNL